MSTIREAVDTDLVDILVMAKGFTKEANKSGYKITWSQDKVSQLVLSAIDREDLCMFVSKDDTDETTGFIIGAATEILFSNDVIGSEIFWWVDENVRGKRVALKLFKTYEDWAVSKGATALTASDLQGIANLAPIYKALGYTPSEVTYRKDIQ